MISHEHRCIFTHIPKTGGKSVRSLFGLPEFERHWSLRAARIEPEFGHRPLADIMKRTFFASYYKFAFVRNPYDRLVSAFFYLDNGGCNDGDRAFREDHLAIYGGSFAAFVEDLPKLMTATHFRPQVHWLCDRNGEVLADVVGRYEQIAEDMTLIARTIGLTCAELPIINAGSHECYKIYYDDATKRRVGHLYGDDLETFSYAFQ